MLFMVIETFPNCDPVPIYKHLRDAGRGLPDGLKYVNSWIEPNFRRCFQVMECDDLRLLQEWSLHWHSVGIDFEFVPVVESKDVQAVVAPHLD